MQNWQGKRCKAVHLASENTKPSNQLTPALSLTVRAAAVERHPADPAVFIVGHPQPGGHPVPLSDLHLHPPSLSSAQTLNSLPYEPRRLTLACELMLTDHFWSWILHETFNYLPGSVSPLLHLSNSYSWVIMFPCKRDIMSWPVCWETATCI